tara:strand:- start:465 stop:695 length:231 start_codon:yes stop_codon:yes gene_type:complete
LRFVPWSFTIDTSTDNNKEKQMKLNERKRVATLAPAYVSQVREALAIIKNPMKVCLNPQGMTMDQAQAIALEFKAL